MSLALGQALDPINDLVERFSWVMLASLTSLGIQKFLIEISPFVSVQIVLMLALLSFLMGLWLPMVTRDNFKKLGQVLLISAILIRFSVPTMAYLNNQVYVAFLQERYDKSIEVLVQTATELEGQQFNSLNDAPGADQEEARPEETKRWWDSTQEIFSGAVSQGKQMLDIKGKVDSIKKSTLGLIDRVVDLIVVFTLTTIVLPLLFLWGILKLGQLVVGRGINLISIDWLGKRD